ncbi:MAG: type III secretion system inner membrane ring subunit SctD [Ottowia sp.]|uniref:type III secretion system inner membrane ring subunit SctD n=1 Tax=Ottowia sp. TaxID=1898956 RepID=UPI003C758502
MMRDVLALELRVLSGRHAGACAVARNGLLVGVSDEADVILTDLDPGAGLARLHLVDEERWLLASADAEPDAKALAQAPRMGVPAYWGQLALCVSAPHTDWPPIPQAVPALSAEPEIVSEQEKPGIVETVHAPETSSVPAKRSRYRAVWPWITVLLVLALLGAVVWERLQRGTQGAAGPVVSVVADLTAEAQRQVPDLALAIAQVDPALRLQLTPQRDGRVQVSGWVDAVAQFDRLADVLGMRRPAPLMRVFVASDVRTELRAQLAGSYPQLDFSPGGPGVLRVRGIVLSEAGEAEVLAAVRPLLPAGMKLASELRLAEKLAPDVQAALAAAGFGNVRAHWDGTQIVAALSLSDQSRGRLENTLIALAERFPGLPLRVVPELLAPTSQAAHAKPPFPIRGVVGGDVPYLVLPGGGKLLPGGTHAGWRLQSIEPDVLVFDAPRRLVVAR